MSSEIHKLYQVLYITLEKIKYTNASMENIDKLNKSVHNKYTLYYNKVSLENHKHILFILSGSIRFHVQQFRLDIMHSTPEVRSKLPIG